MKSKDQKRMEAEQRQEAHDALTVEQKLAKIKTCPGNSAREIARLCGGLA